MRKIKESPAIFKKRRDQVVQQMGEGSAMILISSPLAIRNGSVEHPFRQDSSLYFLTGWEEPETVLFLSGGKSSQMVLFVPPKDPDKEMWEGFRFGPEGAKQEFGADQAFEISELSKELPKLLAGKSKVFLKTASPSPRLSEVIKLIDQAHRNTGRSGLPFPQLIDPSEILAPLRSVKDPAALVAQRLACEATAQAHRALMAICKPGMNELELAGYFKYQIAKRGCPREGYNGIFASGENACTLHYTFNDQNLKASDLILIDAGGEYNYHTADITRTFPVSGKFTAPQKDLYQAVLQVQKEVIEYVRPGVSFEDLQSLTCKLLSAALVELKILKSSVDEVLEKKLYLPFYPHRVGHYLGMDVHDVGFYKTVEGKPLPLMANHVLTIEPGLYFPANHPQVPEAFRGLGVRIEDDILVTPTGSENLTQSCPKEVAELEGIIGQG